MAKSIAASELRRRGKRAQPFTALGPRRAPIIAVRPTAERCEWLVRLPLFASVPMIGVTDVEPPQKNIRSNCSKF